MSETMTPQNTTPNGDQTQQMPRDQVSLIRTESGDIQAFVPDNLVRAALEQEIARLAGQLTESQLVNNHYKQVVQQLILEKNQLQAERDYHAQRADGLTQEQPVGVVHDVPEAVPAVDGDLTPPSDIPHDHEHGEVHAPI